MDGEVAVTDAALAPLLEDIRAAGTPTLAIITGDHGESLGEHGEETHGLFAYEATLRVPLIVAELRKRLVQLVTCLGRPKFPAFRCATWTSCRRCSTRSGSTRPPTCRGAHCCPPASAAVPDRARRLEAMTSMLNRGWAPLWASSQDAKDMNVRFPSVRHGGDARESINLAGREPERDRTLTGVLRAFNAALPGERRKEDPEAAA